VLQTHTRARTHQQEYVSLCFSPDGKLLLAQGGGPDWNLLLWAWEKSKVASSVCTTNLQGSPVVQVGCPAATGTHQLRRCLVGAYAGRACRRLRGRHRYTCVHRPRPCRPASALATAAS
jgi:hypothetical protein